ncbi:hypothetical protein [Klebsiella quasipneumoniae]|uniref:hypothetical protein n=3 Tax=Klebsiella TaxID=570 RepID=UPI0021D075CF|nr:hypothetical protein [Klebsiella quasipneumoniae]MCP6601396.1 hypothetical protein [Klebsiella pneumoniae]HEO9214071.1 hypothetical protein [Klebsiella quasipneumoniae subsp. similipneumoniae]MCP6712864.1 hypothetical protein [Klebsiella pneumoniae]MCU6521984.1 hypothetical protein [Klebsiella quasipneumoniae]HBW3128273.1 hypothetical protein [Klebsiella pneumoniae]
MTIAIDRLKEVTRDFGRRHIAYQMARELLEIYSGNGPLVWNALSDFPPEVNGKYLVITSYGDIRTACYDCESGEWRASDGTITGVIKWMDLPAAPQEAINALIPLVSRNEQEGK